MLIRNMLLKYYAPADDNNDAGGAGGEGSGASQDKIAAGLDELIGGKKEPEQKEPEKKEPEKKEPEKKEEEHKSNLSDAEARLLKDLMKQKEKATLAQTKAAELETRLKEFEGIDPVAVRQLLAEKQQQKEAELEAKGQWDVLKQSMIEAHTQEKSSLQSEIENLKAQLSNKNSQLDEATIGNKFANSKFITEETTIASPSKARALYGQHFEMVDGELVGYNKPRGEKDRAPLVDGVGKNLSFDDAMRKIIESDPDRDALIRVKPKAGANSGNLDSKAPIKTDVKASSVDKITSGLAGLQIKLN